MTESIDAIAAAREIKATYRRYLQSLLAVRDADIDAAMRKAIDTTPMLDKGPYLEATPPYRAGASARELIDNGVLTGGFASLGSDVLPLDRPLYAHQEQAIRKVTAGRNVIVASGTGSGKTESFLLPILDSLVREHERDELDAGVRALLLYPMNALANDQMKRLRQVLAGYPQITFGRYTGDTETDPHHAREAFDELNIGEPMLPNELLSREEMRKSPPHLLLTNFAMLEYLLLRPLDMPIFGAQGDSKWRFIVVDEAHVYDGSQGAEIGMLLRRVRDRVVPDRAIQCIATSATIGGGSDPTDVTRFATNLFGQPFEWVDDDPSRQDLIVAERTDEPDAPSWGPLSAADYLILAGEDDRDRAVLTTAHRNGWRPTGPDHDTAADALQRERSFATLRATLAAGPQPFDQVASAVFAGDPDAGPGLAAMVELGSALRARDDTTPLSARYHLFLRATEGAFTCLSPTGPHAHLARHLTCPDCAAPVFEIGSCTRCGAVHVVGTQTTEGGVPRLRPRKAGAKGTWYVLGRKAAMTDEDEEAVADDRLDVTAEEARLCAHCGAIGKANAAGCAGCGSSDLRGVRKLRQHGEEIAGCLICGARGTGTVRVFETGSDASGAVIATSLYQRLPPGSGPGDGRRPGKGRKLLAFSDSRQAAAYFAPYLEESYGRLQRRRLIAQGLRAARADEESAEVDEVVFTTRAAADHVGHFGGGMTAQAQERVVAPWVMAEVLAMDDRQSLEGLGLASVSLYRDPAWQAPAPLLALGLTEDEAWAFLQQLVRTLRQQGAVTMRDDVPSNHEIFAPRLGPIRVRLSGPESVRKVLSWLPGKGTNRRIDYVTRVLAALGSAADPADVLGGVWAFLTARDALIDWLKSSSERSLGVLHQVDHRRLRLGWVTADRPIYRCDACRRTSPFSVRGVCPAMACEGTLEPFVAPPDEEDRDHYRSIYRTMNAVPLRALEHTAQWSNTEAASIQHRFIHGDVNALSCSTTFELGVDVGELQAVMLRNMPPSTANYLQRAGRAGRRSGATALVVTYAMRRSHDLTRFAEPEVMITGQVRAPYVPLSNERIDRRHAHSVALAAFFRWLFDTTGRIDRKADGFFLGDGNEPSIALVKDFLTPVPDELSAALDRILPADVAATLDIGGGSWAVELIEQLDTVRDELMDEVATLDRLRDEAASKQKFDLAQRYQKVGNTLRKRELLGYLSNHNILPKYGFPVDSVELRTDFGYGKDSGSRLDLTRDLSQAIHEYAPDATLVAGGNLWTSRGIYRLPGRGLPEYQYHVCKSCGGFRHALLQAPEPACPNCGEVAQNAPRVLTIPEFGFVADREPAKPGPRPPKRSWSGAVHVLAQPPEARSRTIPFPGGRITAHVGPRGRLISVAYGPSNMGYWICEWCGHGSARSHHPKTPPKHNHLLKNTPCTGRQQLLDLAHEYETDLLTLDTELPGLRTNRAGWNSVLYAIIEAASETLEIARDDIGGSLSPTAADAWSITLFDAVPGGAGHVLQIEKNLERVLEAALRRVSNCECGPETSCYGCLRSYGNQSDHDELSRGEAERVLRRLIDKGRP